MNATQSSILEQQPDLSALAASAQQLLDSEVDLVTARGVWDIAADEQQRPILVLSVHDAFDGQAIAQFQPAELKNESHLRSRFRDVKGAILRISGWRRNLRSLYLSVEQWLQIMNPPPYIEEHAITLNEMRSGPYGITALSISGEGRQATLDPIATWIVGADGRADLRGVGGPFVFVVNGDRWSWVEPGGTGGLQPLTKELFIDLLQACWE